MSKYEAERNYQKAINSSTPNNRISSRKPIHHPSGSVSPIRKPRALSKERREHQRAGSETQLESAEPSLSDEENEISSQSYSSASPYISGDRLRQIQSVSSNTSFDESQSVHKQDKKVGIIETCLFCIGILVAVITYWFFISLPENVDAVTIKDLQHEFPLQSSELWTALESGVVEVETFNKPSVFVLLYDDETEQTLERILTNVSKYVMCTLNKNCLLKPIILTSNNLKTEKVRLDYGYVITKYKDELENSVVMIVKNLDEVPGEVAPAFHSMCDEYTPLVAKAVFFFTIKVKNLRNLQQRNMEIVEEVLRNNWNNLDNDIFEPLFTRISSMVLRITPEKVQS